MKFTYEETQLMALYNRGTREDTIAALTEMKGYLGADDADLKALTDSVLEKLANMTDAEYAELDLTVDFGGEDGETDAG